MTSLSERSSAPRAPLAELLAYFLPRRLILVHFLQDTCFGIFSSKAPLATPGASRCLWVPPGCLLMPPDASRKPPLRCQYVRLPALLKFWVLPKRLWNILFWGGSCEYWPYWVLREQVLRFHSRASASVNRRLSLTSTHRVWCIYIYIYIYILFICCCLLFVLFVFTCLYVYMCFVVRSYAFLRCG